MSFLHADFFGNSALEWLTALTLAVGLFAGFYLLRAKGLKKMSALATRLRFPAAGILFETLQKTSMAVMLVLAVYIAAQSLSLPQEIMRFLRVTAFVLFSIQMGVWASGLLGAWSKRYRETQIRTNPGAVTTIGAVQLILSIVIWTSVLLLVLDNLGFNVTTLIAGLGIGGVAVALALQGVLGDLFASLFIVIDRTFIVGDFLIVDDYMGNVEYIGWKTTRLRSLSGEQIVFSNASLLSSRIRNYGRMYRRRIENRFSVSPRTNIDQLKLIPVILREAIEAQEKTRFDRAHFKAFNTSDPLFEYIYYVESPDFNTYMDIQQAINLRLHERFAAEGISLQRESVSELVPGIGLIEKLEEWRRLNGKPPESALTQH